MNLKNLTNKQNQRNCVRRQPCPTSNVAPPPHRRRNSIFLHQAMRSTLYISLSWLFFPHFLYLTDSEEKVDLTRDQTESEISLQRGRIVIVDTSRLHISVFHFMHVCMCVCGGGVCKRMRVCGHDGCLQKLYQSANTKGHSKSQRDATKGQFMATKTPRSWRPRWAQIGTKTPPVTQPASNCWINAQN